jgi:hypothetical protein
MIIAIATHPASGPFAPSQMFVYELVLGVLLFYFIYLQLRRRKYKSIARQLGAEYHSEGFFKAGKITGSGNGRQYTIDTRATARYKSSSTWTMVSVQCANKGIPLQITGGFFRAFPDWRYASTVGDRKQKLLGKEIALLNSPVPLQEKQKLQVQGLFQAFALLHSALLMKGRLRVQADQVSFATRGVLRNSEEATQMIWVLSQIADRVESDRVIA